MDAGARRTAGNVAAGARRVAGGARERIRSVPAADRVYRTGVGVVGGGTVLLGLALIPLPGPGSLIALGGVALLGTEFEPARRVSVKANAAARRAAAAVKDRRARRREQA
ncbi:hypothetical protein GCM10010988_31620 [Cnuibacter physcomitrellae]|uniref:Uncharacterized protein n=1 Tax=Cnuibacter physcomitrellae TaxID=1619308 RepID=A0A1X9LGR1_9MICO|nr:PGPGW domain-containing protein [Cnuibacter physcomitrellae]ARJ04395.1 hypothetical protein B5808_03505 [Cnuibacter physcomitrellae]GGI40944.1 hypothetical protein GCM10010988_31620 [Cnuibacter physcomitrellae]